MAATVTAATVTVVGAAAAAGSESALVVTARVQLSNTTMSVSPRSVPSGSVTFVVRNGSSRSRAFEVVGKGKTRLIAPGGSVSFATRFTQAGTKPLRATSPAAYSAARKQSTFSGSIRVVAPKRSTTMIADLGLTLVGTFTAPTFVVSPPGDMSRLLVVQQNGLVSLVKDGVLQPKPFLDLRSVVIADGEKGLLSIAFAPDYATSGLVYAYFNNREGNIRVVEYRRSLSDPDTIDRTQRRLLFSLIKQAADHNGGMMQFGPDGFLYIAVGDGGAAPPRVPIGATGQTLTDLFGSILRIDPRNGTPYAIPSTNPFISTSGARPEIVAYGLRNPWRFWIDPKLDRMMIGDVGEGAREEIDELPLGKLGGLDFGWPCKEGNTVPDKVSLPATCATATLTPPVWQYPHGATRCSVTGGVVARDPRLPELDGLYLWSDLCDGRIYALDPTGTPGETPINLTVEEPTSFGTDAANRIYVASANGAVYRIDPK
jgi:glucose/arabinose dehydrogenase